MAIRFDHTGAGAIVLSSDAADTLKVDGHKVWHENNDGSGSLLDADLLDTYEASAFTRKAEDATVTGNWTFKQDTIGDFVIHRNGTTGAAGIGFRNDDAGMKGYIGFSDDGLFNVYDAAGSSKLTVDQAGNLIADGNLTTGPGAGSLVSVGKSTNGWTANIGSTQHTDAAASSYRTYFGYDCYWDDTNDQWVANRTTLGRKMVMDMGYHLNAIRFRYYNGDVTVPWADSAWTTLLNIDAVGNITCGTSRGFYANDGTNTAYFNYTGFFGDRASSYLRNTSATGVWYIEADSSVRLRDYNAGAPVDLFVASSSQNTSYKSLLPDTTNANALGSAALRWSYGYAGAWYATDATDTTYLNHTGVYSDRSTVYFRTTHASGTTYFDSEAGHYFRDYNAGSAVNLMRILPTVITNYIDMAPGIDNTYDLGSNTFRFAEAHVTTYYEAGTALASKYLALAGGTLTGTLITQAVYPDGNETRSLGLSGTRWQYVYGNTLIAGNGTNSVWYTPTGAYSDTPNSYLRNTGASGVWYIESEAGVYIRDYNGGTPVNLFNFGVSTHTSYLSIVPSADSTHTLGTQAAHWSTVFADNHRADGANYYTSMDASSGFTIRPSASLGGWARGMVVIKQSDSLRQGGAGFLGSAETITGFYIGINQADWWTNYVLGITATSAVFDVNVTPKTNNAKTLGTDALRWSGVYATAFYEAGTALSSKYAPQASPTFTGTITAAAANFSGACTFTSNTAPTIRASSGTTNYTAGYRDIPQEAKTAGYTLALSDAGKHISQTTGNLTIPANASVAFPIGTAITYYNDSGSSQTIGITTDTLRLAGSSSTGTRTVAQYGVAFLLKVGTTTWVVSGTGVS